LRRQVLKHPMMTAAELQTSVAELRVVSERTIQCTLQIDLKMPSRVAAMKPLLTKKMKAKRIKIFPGLTSLHCCRLVQSHVFGRVHVQVHHGLQVQGEEAKGVSRYESKNHHQDREAP
jgi:hypothetical protein